MRAKTKDLEEKSEKANFKYEETTLEERKGDSSGITIGSETSRRIIAGFTEISSRVETSRRLLKTGQQPKKKEAEYLKREIEMDEHLISLEDLYSRLETNEKSGLDQVEAAMRLEKNGLNILTSPNTVPTWLIFVKVMFGGFAAVLWIAAVLAFVGFGVEQAFPDTQSHNSISSNLMVAIVLLIVCVVSGVFTFYQENKSRQVMKGFEKLVPQKSVVLRDGFKFTIDAVNLVVGDIVIVNGGDKIPADIRVIECSNFKVDNSSLTGESEPQSRKVESTHENPLETANIVFYSTNALEGELKGIVINTGDRTVIGHIAKLVSESKKSRPPIELEIKYLTNILAIVAVSLGIIFASVGFALGDLWQQNLVLFIGVLVGNVPEGLLPTITVSLTLAAKRMARKNVLVKDLKAIETLGRTSTICSDKTGTLTQNRMCVSHIWIGYDCKLAVDLNSYSFDKTFLELYKVAALCNRAEFEQSNPSEDKHGIEPQVIGDASESALLRFCEMVQSVESYRNQYTKRAEIPFNSTNKFQISIYSEKENAVLFIKGAPERVLDKCSYYILDGTRYDITEDYKRSVTDNILQMAELGERVMGFAVLYLNSKDYPSDYLFDTEQPNFPMSGYCFVGLVSMMDPPKAKVPDAIQKCHDATVRVIMITGDHPITAKSIAKKIGIIRTEAVIELYDDIQVEKWKMSLDLTVEAMIIHGDQLRKMTEEDLDRILTCHQIVFARTSPQQKLMIVEGVQRRGETVAVTGDGVNDSPALKQANIGVAMGIVGSDVSKEVSDIILLDDDFSSIVNGIEEGRLIFDNLKKSIAYTLSSKFPEMLPFLFYIVFQIPPAISAILILCVDVGTDLLPAVSLAYEAPESDIMRRSPRVSNDRLIAPRLLIYSYVQLGLLQSLAGFVNFAIVWYMGGVSAPALFYNRGNWKSMVSLISKAQAAYFVGIVICRIAVLFISKTHAISLFRQPFFNYYLLSGVLLEIILMVILVYVPGIRDVFGTAPLEWYYWFIPIPFALLILFYDETRKLAIRKFPVSRVAQIFNF